MPDALTHPTPQQLADFGLGKLPERAAATVAAHLESCPACRKAVAGVSADSFLVKVRAAWKEVPSSSPSQAPLHNPPSSAARPGIPIVPCPDLPPELARHPKYLILRELGRGGMGVVYQARQSVMNRPVVIKVINRSLLEQPGALERFRREVRAAASLLHPNIVTAYDAEQAGQLHMLVMEFVPGQSLAEILEKKGPLPVAHACHYMRQVALGLQHAHECGMVHRDIKPQNLILTPKGRIKILDFGLAKVISERGNGKGLTSSDHCMGTPEYCAPEQAEDARSADIRADLYSLGCTLYGLLAVRPPFREDTPMKTFLAHIQKAPQPLTELRPDVPERLWRVVARLLAKEPAQRYQKPIEVMQALSPFAKPGAKPEAKGGSTVPQGVGSPAKGTVIAADTGEIQKILQDVAGKTPPKKVPAKEPSPCADVIDTKAAPKKVVRAHTTARPSLAVWWKRPRVLVAAISVSLVMMLMAAIIIKVKVQTPNGDTGRVMSSISGTGKPNQPSEEAIVVLEIDQPGAEVSVDGRRVSVNIPGDHKPIEIKVEPGKKHRLEVKKGGFKVFGEEVELNAGGHKSVIVRLEAIEKSDKAPAGKKSSLPEPRKPKRENEAPNPIAEVKEKWVPLFNGKDLTGWKPHTTLANDWRVEKNVLRNTGSKGGGLYSERNDYRDFILRLELRVNDDFIGCVHFRAPFDLAAGYHAFLDCSDTPRSDKGKKTGGLGPGIPHPILVPVDKSPVRAGDWFKMEIIAKGSHLVIKVNEKTTTDYEDQQRLYTRGHILLGKSEKGAIEFRKIEIQELTPLPENQIILPPDASIDDLREALKNADPAVQEITVARLVDLGAKAEPAMYALGEILTNPKARIIVRRNAALAIAHIGPRAKLIAPALAQAINPSEPYVIRLFSAEALSQMKYPANGDAIPAILKAIEKDSNPLVRQKCVEALFEVNPKEKFRELGADKVLEKLLYEKDEITNMVRYEAARKLAQAFNNEAPDKTVDVLLEMLRNTQLKVYNSTDVKVVGRRSEFQEKLGGDARYMAAEALSWLGKKASGRKDVVEALKAAAKDSDSKLRETASTALKVLGIP